MKTLFSQALGGKLRLAAAASILALGLGINDALAQLSGTITVGSGGTYTSLTNAGGAFAAINASGTSGPVTFDIISNITEAGTNSLIGGTHAVTITSTTSSQKVLTFNNTSGGTAPNVNSNGGLRIMRANVTIDGVATGIAAADAATKRLSFVRTQNAPVIGVFNDVADNVTIKNCDIVPQNNQVTFNFGNLSTTTGIDNFELSGCTIHPATGNRGGNVFVAVTASTARHDNGKIIGNSFYNFGRTDAAATVISLVTTLGWEVKNNHFFQTSTIAPTGNRTWTVIQLPSTCGNATVTGNFIGGSDVNCGGATKFTTTVASGLNGWVYLRPFRLEQAATEPKSVISSNRITNLDLQCRQSGNCKESVLENLVLNGVYDFTDNEFGTGGEIIIRRLDANGTASSPTRMRVSTFLVWNGAGDKNILRNKFENFTFKIENTTGNFGQLDYEGLAIGDENSGGISGTISISKNLIRNFRFEHTGTSTNSVMSFVGIKLPLLGTGVANVTVDSNIINNVTLAPLANTATMPSNGACTAGQTFFSSADGILIGNSPSNITGGSLVISKNRIYDFKSTIQNTMSGIRSIGMGTGVLDVQAYNNVISFNGGDGSGGNNNAIYKGIAIEPTAVTTESYYLNNNSISISGTASGSNNTACINITSNASSVNLRNNAIQNTRMGSSGLHYVYFNLSTGLNTNNNVLNSFTTLGHSLGVDYGNLAAWSGAFFDNSGSQQVLLNFSDPVNGNLAITNCTPITGVGTTVSAPYFNVTKDILGATHSSPVSPGAYKISAGSGAYSWVGTVSSSWTNAANWCGGSGGVPGASDDVNISGSPTPSFWPIISSNASVNNLTITGGSTQFTVNSGVTLTINGDFSFSGSPANLTTTGSTISFPNTVSQTINNLKAHNLTLSGNTTKNLTGTTSVSNTLTVSGASTLGQVTAGGTLSVNGFFTGTGRVNGTATSNLSIGGSTTTTFNLSSTSQFQDITLNSSGNSTININGALTIRNLTVSNGTVNLNNSTVNISGDLVKSGVGVVSAGTSTVVLAGAGTQNLSGPWNFNNLSIEKLTNANVDVSSGSTISVNGVLTLKQTTVSIGVETNFNIGNSSLAIGAPIVDAGAGTERLVLSSGSSLTLNGTAVWPFPSIGGTAPGTLNNFTLNTTGSAGTLNANLTVSGTATFTQGTLNLGSNSLTFNGPIAGSSGTVSTSGNSSLTVGNTGAMTYFPATSGSFSQLVHSRPGTLNLSSALTANKMSVSLGSTLNLGSNNLTITATDATSGITNNGTLTSASGTTTFGGSFAQSLSGTGTYNLAAVQINNATAGGLTVSSGTVNLFGTVTLAASAKLNASGGTTTLKHTATQRGSIAALPNGAQVNGNVTVESRTATNSPGWYFVGGTTKGLTVNNLNAQLMVRGIPGAPAPTGTGSPNVLFYNEATSTNSGWVPASSLSNDASRGFRTYLDVNFMNLNNQTLKFTGQLNVGNGADQSMVTGETFSWPVTFTPSGWSGGGWNLLHNPYPSNLLLDNSANWTSSNMSPTFHFWNANAGTYMTWNRTTSSGTKPNGLVAIGQSFFGQALAGSPSITVAEGAKSSSTAAVSRQGISAPTLTIRFGQANNSRYDLAQVVLDQAARFSFDAQLDANNLNGGFFDVTTNTTNGQELTVNAIPTPGQLYTIPMTYASYLGAGQQVSFDFSGVSNMSNIRLYLLDRELGTSTEITEGMSYNFTDNAPAHTRVSSRFAISLVPGAVTSLDPSLTGLNLSLYPNPATKSSEVVIVMSGAKANLAQIELIDATGKLINSQSSSVNDGRAVIKLDGAVPAGVYQVKVKSGDAVSVQRLVVR